jgi:predicted metal-dependent HD superfamily phosphohydrolase
MNAGAPTEVMALKRRWEALFARLAILPDRAPSIDGLIMAYQSPSRHYHNLKHICECLDELDAVKELCAAPDAVELAIWYHDVVYDATRGDNEERSADIASTALRSAGASQPLIDQVRLLILATKHAGVPADDDAMILVDIDLSILGRTAEEFATYEQAIRREYAHVAEQAFRAGRAKILQRFLERAAIYGVAFMRQKYEASARANLNRSIKLLTSG